MMNNVSKGKKAEKEFAQILEDRGYQVWKFSRSRWNNYGDIFGLFDLIAVCPNEVLGVQVKCNKTGGAVKKLREWTFHPPIFKKLVAVRSDDGTWREVIV